MPPALVDEYRLVRPLGSGGMGQVYLAHDQLLDRPVAVKFIASIEPDERRRARFLIEGRAIARLSHPNVVLVHRVGEVEGRPYLVSEYVRGRPLSSLQKPVERSEVARIGARLARGLADAHRQGVLHRDLKPANAVLADDGEVKLLDFGLAKLLTELPIEAAGLTASEDAVPPSLLEVVSPSAADPDDPPPSELTHPGSVLGTPAYMAPETLRGDVATRASDVFSLGAVLFELATGSLPRPPRAPGQPHQMLSLAVAVRARERSPGLDPALASIIDRCLERAPERRFPSADELAEALSELEPAGQRRSVPHGNPYRGLRAFEAEHRGLFFGRDADVRAVIERVQSEPLVLVAGDSGVGKSSLCRAGVLPLIADGVLERGRSWSTVTLMPGRRPITALCAALAQSLDAPEEALGAWVRSEPAALARALRQRFQKTGIATLLFFDQLEELLTLSDPAEAALLSEALGHLAVQAAGTRVLAAVRGDFFTRLAALPGLGPEVSRALYLLRPLTAEQIRATVVGPARCKGVTFESEALVTTLVSSTAAAAGGLPLLQFALAELWDARDASAGVIREEALTRIGGVEGALARHADGVLAAMLPEQRTAARSMLVRLVTAEGTRTRRTAAELGATAGASREALEALVHGRLLVAREAEGATAYEVAHEALISGWRTLHELLESDGDRRIIRTRVEGAASEWARLGRAPDALWHDRQLEESMRVDPNVLGPLELDFLTSSRRAVRRRRTLQGAALIAIPLLASLVVGVIRLRARQELDRKVQAQLLVGRERLAKAVTTDEAARSKRKVALTLYDGDFAPSGSTHKPITSTQWEQAERAWAEALALDREADRFLLAATEPFETASLLNPGGTEAPESLARVTFKRLELARRNHRTEQASELENRLSRYDRSGSLQALLRAPARMTIGTSPAGTSVAVQEYVAAERGLRLAAGPARHLGSTPLDSIELQAGSYLLTLQHPDRAELRYPVLLTPGESLSLTLSLPTQKSIPAGYIFIAPGRFLFGSADEELVRADIDAPPEHEVSTAGYLIARNEVTFGDWLQFLEELPEPSRSQREPRHASVQGSLEVSKTPKGKYRLSIKPTTRTYEANEKESIRYRGRQLRAAQSWEQFPVLAISYADSLEYVAWLGRTGRVPHARLCNEYEWERAARGADKRIYTTGFELSPDDANVDLTYGKDPEARGPDEVHSHPASDSPFGVHDMQGNALEMVSSIRSDWVTFGRGGAWFYDYRLTGRLTNHFPNDSSTRSVAMGLRVCADAPRD